MLDQQISWRLWPEAKANGCLSAYWSKTTQVEGVGMLNDKKIPQPSNLKEFRALPCSVPIYGAECVQPRRVIPASA